ncbi:NUMOD4 domain-containing protein [Lactococcus cremoris]|uniref:NUMOD4 domain-containing protein n=1 Tax=Lactococcus lactis subsp. cremoris TaxID=1359 RepID=UPI0024A7170F|nr:NUMOD4 domain-containing protein [Lactococcus cremoris]
MANTNTEIEWKSVEGFEGQYMVSNTGLVKSLKGKNGRIDRFDVTLEKYSKGCLMTITDVISDKV